MIAGELKIKVIGDQISLKVKPIKIRGDIKSDKIKEEAEAYAILVDRILDLIEPPTEEGAPGESNSCGFRNEPTDGGALG
jgi:hypothetical protein